MFETSQHYADGSLLQSRGETDEADSKFEAGDRDLQTANSLKAVPLDNLEETTDVTIELFRSDDSGESVQVSLPRLRVR